MQIHILLRLSSHRQHPQMKSLLRFRDSEQGIILSIVLLLPPAPAALVLVGLALATLSALSAAAFLRIAVFGPPGGVGDDGRAVLAPTDCAVLTGELGRGEDWANDS